MASHQSNTRKRVPGYSSWCGMIQRCHNPDNPDYYLYGGKGVRVCNRWRWSFMDFLADMGLRPSPRHSLDRYPDRDGNYEPNNCRWATDKEQANNRRHTIFLEHDGKRLTIEEWSEVTGVCYFTIISRIKKQGWSVSRALTTFPRSCGVRSRSK